MKPQQPTLRCPCGEQDLGTAYTYEKSPPGEILFGVSGPYYREYRDCRNCGHFFSRHEMEVTDLYSGAYADATYGGADGVRAAFRRIVSLPPEKSDNAGRVRRVCEYAKLHVSPFPAKPTLLDVGAGLGVFPFAMKSAGWEVMALDPDPRNERHYHELVGVKPVIGDFMDIATDGLGEAFDVVSFNKVLEHVPDPVPMLVRAAGFCRPGGLVYLEVPDVAASIDGQNREEFLFGHEHVFSIASTSLLMQRSGIRPLRIESLREPSGKFTIFAFGSPREVQR